MRVFLTLIIVTMSLAWSAALAQNRPSAFVPPPTSPWRVHLIAGADFNAVGNVLSSANGAILGQPTKISSVSWADAFDTPLTLGIEGGYMDSKTSEIFGRFSYTSAEGKQLQAGEISGGVPLLVRFDKYEDFALEGGYRWYFPSSSPFRLLTPWIAPFAGIKYVSAMKADFVAPLLPLSALNQDVYKSGIVPSFGIDIGLMYPTTSSFAIGVQTGIHYQLGQGAAKGFLQDGSNTGLDGAASQDGRLTVPFTFRAALKL
ncbi:MAG: hypothetical protein ACK5O9_07425 [Holosporales bacterium]|jgi:hypothetical protein